jgi:hypothetical protein
MPELEETTTLVRRPFPHPLPFPVLLTPALRRRAGLGGIDSLADGVFGATGDGDDIDGDDGSDAFSGEDGGDGATSTGDGGADAAGAAADVSFSTPFPIPTTA